MFHALSSSHDLVNATDLPPRDLLTTADRRWSWDDIRYFVAAARSGSTLAASRELGVSQTTVARRIDQLEQEIGKRLFERRQGGYRLTAAGQEILTEADRVRVGVLDFLSLFPAGQPPLSGRLRITTEAELGAAVVLPALGRVRLDAPSVSWTVLIHERPADLLAGEADVRVGHGCRGAGLGLHHRRLSGRSKAASARGADALWFSYAGRRVNPALAGILAEAVEAELSAAATR